MLGLSVLKQVEDLEVEETPGWSDLLSQACLDPWLVLDVTEKMPETLNSFACHQVLCNWPKQEGPYSNFFFLLHGVN